ncbi:MAG: polysaccharide biosynthesis/export family protein [Advenella sp.]
MRIKTTLLLAVTSAALSACAMAPGMYMGGPESARHELENNEQLKDGEAPAGALISINAELIKQQSLNQPAYNSVNHLFGTPGAYTVGPGDVLNIIVWDHPELSLAGATAATSSEGGNVGNGYNVSSDGRIQFPFAGAVKVAGLTELQIREKLTKTLATYITSPQLTVRVQSYRNSRVYLDGEVNSPGLQNLNDIPMTLPEALNRAGGLTKEADRSSIVLSRQGKETHINLAKMTEQGINPNRIMLKNGDMLRVNNRDRAKIFMLGEVLKPAALTMHDGQLTLAQALGEAGGPNISSNPGQVYVIRKGKQEQAEIYHLNANSPTALILASGFQLQPQDMVYVDPARVVRWNRVISNILPSYGAVVSATNNF